jgi:glycosyltransferase involved in cell wall biosynthesis
MGKDATDRRTPRLSVCLLANNAASLYLPGSLGGVGGVEVQYKLLAAQMGRHHDVSLLVRATHSERDRLVPDPGVHLVAMEPGGSGLLGITRRIWGGLRQADAQVYMQSAAGFVTFAAALFCRLRRRAFIYHWASDADLDGALMPSVGIDRRLFRRGRAMAAAQVVQTERQWSLLTEQERASAWLMPNLLDTSIPWREGNGTEVLWVATIKEKAKRPDRFLDLAAALPHRHFRMVGELKGSEAFQAEFRRRLAELPNVHWAGFVPRHGLPEHYAAARVLVNVSDTEGFPNTFLEACASAVPVVSLNVDPNGLLARDGAGTFLAGDVDALPAAVEALFKDKPWQAARAACRKVAAAHAPAAIAERLAAFMASVLERKGSR